MKLMTNHRMVVWILLALSLGSNFQLWNISQERDADKRVYRVQVLQYKNEALAQHLQYEKALRDARDFERRLAEANRKLAVIADREKAAKVRASRSRTGAVRPSNGDAGRSVGVGVSNLKRSSSSGVLRDITMYCPTGNRTASGKWPARGMVATISRRIPFDTSVVIEGIGTFVVEDRIGHSSEFDIFTPSCSEARTFGRQHRRVTIL